MIVQAALAVTKNIRAAADVTGTAAVAEAAVIVGAEAASEADTAVLVEAVMEEGTAVATVEVQGTVWLRAVDSPRNNERRSRLPSDRKRRTESTSAIWPTTFAGTT